MDIRAPYRNAREAAGPTFVADNPGTHYFFQDDGITLCVFCGHSQVRAESEAVAPAEYSECLGDLRSQKKS